MFAAGAGNRAGPGHGETLNAMHLTASEAAAWISLIAAIASAVIGIIAALKGQRADAKADVLNSRADSLAEHARSLDRQITDVAKLVPSDGGTSSSDRLDRLERLSDTERLSAISRPTLSGFINPVPVDRPKDQT